MFLCSLQDTMKHFALTAAPFNKLPHSYVVFALKLNFSAIFIYLLTFASTDTELEHHVVTLTEQCIGSWDLQHILQINPKSKSRLVSLSGGLWVQAPNIVTFARCIQSHLKPLINTFSAFPTLWISLGMSQSLSPSSSGQ